MIEIICIDASFSSEALKFYDEFGVVTPEQDKLYTIRDVIINSNGKTGVLLEEIVNPKVPFKHPILGDAWNEPNWDINRFRTLQGESVHISQKQLQNA